MFNNWIYLSSEITLSSLFLVDGNIISQDQKKFWKVAERNDEARRFIVQTVTDANP